MPVKTSLAHEVEALGEAVPARSRCWAVCWQLDAAMGPDPSLSYCRREPVLPHDAPGTGAVAMPGRALLEEAWALTAVRELRKLFEKDHDTEKSKISGPDSHVV